MNQWHLITKYRIRACSCARYQGSNHCGFWFIEGVNGGTGIYGAYRSWNSALDTVIRSQTRQYYQLTGGAV